MTGVQEIVLRIQLELVPPPEAAARAGDDRLLYTVKEAARLMSVSPAFVNELIARGEIDSRKIGTARRIPRDAIEDYARQRRGGDGT